MSESKSERERDLERLLLRSARLDVPRAEARSRALVRALAELETTGVRWPWRPWIPVASAVVAAAVAALLLRSVAKPEVNPLQPEPPKASSSAARARAPTAPSLPPCPKLVVARGGAPLIDDMEDRNARLLIADGREGYWAVYNDGSGKQVPPGLSALHPERLALARGSSRYALHTSGGKFSIWGSILVGTFTGGGCYDLSAYSGLEFWAKGNTRVHVQLSGIDEIPPESGGLCTREQCYSSPRKSFDLRQKWQRYELGFAELEQLNQPDKLHFDRKRVVQLNISIFREDTPFDVWIDDVRFSEPQ